jgi:hypothetical protein
MNGTRSPFGALVRVIAILALILAILSLPWRGDRPGFTPVVLGRAAGQGALSAGAAVRTIDPGPSPTIGGFPRVRWEAIGQREPITARALVVREPGCAVAIASAELLVVPEKLLEAVKARVADLRLDAVVLGATHTHAGPGGYWDSLAGELGATGWYDQAAFDRIVEAVAGAIREAHGRLGPAEVAVARGRAEGLVRNRTGAEVDGRLLSVRLARPGGEPVAELVTFAAHPTLLGKWNRALSGDWVSAVLAASPRGPRLFFQGAIGDQSVRLPEGLPPEADQPSVYGQAVARAVDGLAVPGTGDSSGVSGVSAVPGTGLSGPSGPRLAVASVAVAPPPLTVLAVPAWLRPATRTVAGGLMPERAAITAVRLGGALLVFTPAEPVEAVGRAWREAAGPQAEVISLANGYLGYVEDPARAAAGTGEARRSYYGPELAGRLEAGVKAAAAAVDAAAR